MARRKENTKPKELIEEYGIKDMKDVHEFVKMLTALDADVFVNYKVGQALT